MPLTLPYFLDIGSRLRALSQPSDQAIWLRLDGGRQELFAMLASEILILSDQSFSNQSECGFLYMDSWPAFWRALPGLLARASQPERLPGCRFRGGVMGFIGYDQAPSGAGFPTAWLGRYSRLVHIDHEAGQACYLAPAGDTTLPARWRALLDGLADTPPQQPAPAFRLKAPFRPLTSLERYRQGFAAIQDYLRNGDCYQVNYTQAFHTQCEGSGAPAFDRLLAASMPAHAAWLSLPQGEVWSLSPELFLRVENGHITTRPIKGTAPRGATSAEDARLRRELEASPKNRAENLMITDLLRHDIGRHAETGSVRVEKLFEVESLPAVHHLVSTVIGELRPGASVTDLVRDCFPGGSITGAPKKRAMEIIAELEDTPRSVYCGSMGFIGVDGEVELNIAIRTLLRTGDDIYAWAGGGIVADSECEAEYEECFHKIGALLRTLEAM